jgi:hypothetical protein
MQNTMKACADGTVTVDQSSGESEVVLVIMHSEYCLFYFFFSSVVVVLDGASKIVRADREVMIENNDTETSS